jgi:hypothetical protein
MLCAPNSLPLIEMRWLCNGGVSLYQTAGLGTKNAEQNVSARWDCINVLCRVPMHGKNARLLDEIGTLVDLGHLRFYYGQIYDPQPHTTAKHVLRSIVHDTYYGVPTLRQRLYSFTKHGFFLPYLHVCFLHN